MVAFRGRGGDNGTGPSFTGQSRDRHPEAVNRGVACVEPAACATGPSVIRLAETAVSRAEIQPETEETLDLSPRYLNRELSWLDFNAARARARRGRRAAAARARAKFLAIFSHQPRRVLPDPRRRPQGAGGARRSPHVARRPAAARAAERDPRARPRARTRAGERVHATTCAGSSRSAGIRIVDWDELEPRIARRCGTCSSRGSSPCSRRSPSTPHTRSRTSRPVAEPRRDRARPARPASSASRASRSRRCCRASCSVPGGARFVPLEQVIAAHLDPLFPGMEIARAPRRSGSRATPTSSSSRRGRGPARRRSRASCAARALGRGRAARGRRRRCRRRSARCSARELELERARRLRHRRACSTSAISGRWTSLDGPS